MRKRIFCFFLTAIGCIVLLCGCSQEETAQTLPGSVSIVVATDLHYLSPELTDRGEYFMRSIENGDGKVVHYIDEITDAFFAISADISMPRASQTAACRKSSHHPLLFLRSSTVSWNIQKDP